MGEAWQPPTYEARAFFPRRTRYCFIVVAWNEGERLRNQLRRMRANAGLADILIADGLVGETVNGRIEYFVDCVRGGA